MFRALDDIDLNIGANEFVTLCRPSGCGKSTLLRIVAGLEEVNEGEVPLDDEAIVGPGADRGMVFQSYTLFPWLRVRENIEYWAEASKAFPYLERAGHLQPLFANNPIEAFGTGFRSSCRAE